MMEEQDILDEMSADHSGSNQETTTTDDHTFHLPPYVVFLSLGLKAISTVIISEKLASGDPLMTTQLAGSIPLYGVLNIHLCLDGSSPVNCFCLSRGMPILFSSPGPSFSGMRRRLDVLASSVIWWPNIVIMCCVCFVSGDS